MTRRTNNYNAFEAGTTGPLAIGATSVAVDSAAGLVAPLYLVIDPDDPSKREWVRVNTINVNNLENLVRNLPGSVGDVLHDAGAKVRSVPTKQIFDDVFQDMEDNLLTHNLHVSSSGDPHAAAGYLTVPVGDARYLQLDGGTMSGFLTLFADPTSPLHSASKQYADALETAANAYSDSLDHDHTTPIAAHAGSADAHHFKYTDTEAVAAVDAARGTLGVVAVGSLFTGGSVADNVVLTTVVLPNTPGKSCRIVVTGVVGGVNPVEASFEVTGTGVIGNVGDKVEVLTTGNFAAAARWADAPLNGQTVSILANATGLAFYRGHVEVIQVD